MTIIHHPDYHSSPRHSGAEAGKYPLACSGVPTPHLLYLRKEFIFMRILESLAAVSIAAIITGCASSHQPYVYSTPSGQVISAGPPRNPADVALDTSIRAELDRYGDLAADSPNVQVYSQNGVVNLTGDVRNEKE